MITPLSDPERQNNHSEYLDIYNKIRRRFTVYLRRGIIVGFACVQILTSLGCGQYELNDKRSKGGKDQAGAFIVYGTPDYSTSSTNTSSTSTAPSTTTSQTDYSGSTSSNKGSV